mgnify:CR=1 FL=1
MKTNINIINEDNIYNYLIEYERYSTHGELYNEKYMVDEDNVILYDSQSNFYNSSNDWNILEDNGSALPVNNYGVAKVRVYFPEFSLDKYVNKCLLSFIAIRVSLSILKFSFDEKYKPLNILNASS